MENTGPYPESTRIITIALRNHRADLAPFENQVNDPSGLAIMLGCGNAGVLVYAVGRKQAAHLIPLLEEIEAYELCGVLRRAVEHGVSWRDRDGTVDIYDPFLTLWLAAA